MIAPTSEESACLPYVERYENSDWTSYFISTIRIILRSHQSYQIYCTFLIFLGGNHGDKFQDIRGPDSFMTISFATFGGLLISAQGI